MGSSMVFFQRIKSVKRNEIVVDFAVVCVKIRYTKGSFCLNIQRNFTLLSYLGIIDLNPGLRIRKIETDERRAEGTNNEGNTYIIYRYVYMYMIYCEDTNRI